MIEGLPVIDGFPIVGLSAPVLLGVAVLMLLTGRLIPRKTYEDLITDRDNWRAAHALSEQQRSEQSKQIDHLLEYGKTVDSIMRALPHPFFDNLPHAPTKAELDSGSDQGEVST